MHGVILEGNSYDHQGWSYHMLVMKSGRIIMQNTNNVRHTPVTVELYLRDQITGSGIQTTVTFQSTDTTDPCILCNLYTVHTNMYINHGTNMKSSSSDEHNPVHNNNNNNNNSDRHYKIMDTQQDNVGATNNANMPWVEDVVGINNMQMPQNKHKNGPETMRACTKGFFQWCYGEYGASFTCVENCCFSAPCGLSFPPNFI